MASKEQFSDILNECLERLLLKGKSVEQCLESYPEQAAELRALLETALAAREASAIQPRAEFKARARYEFSSVLAQTRARSRPAFGWLPKWAGVTIIALGLLLTSSGTVLAAGYSMPDSPLYPLKLTAEQVQLKLTPSLVGKAELYVQQADRRVTEIIYMAGKGDAGEIEVITQALDERMAHLATLASSIEGNIPEESSVLENEPKAMAPMSTPTPKSEESKEASITQTTAATTTAPTTTKKAEASKDTRAAMNKQAKLRMKVAEYATSHPAVLRAALERAPESAKPALKRAIMVLSNGYNEALKALED